MDDLNPKPLHQSPEPQLPPMPEASGVEALSPEPDHLDGLTIAEPAGAAGDSPIGHAGAPALYTKDEFFQNFVGLHGIAAVATGLQSFAVHEKEAGAARAASDAIYDIAAETPWLHFLLEPTNIWLQRALAIGAFAVPKGKAVILEIKARRTAQAIKDGTYTPDGKHNAKPAAKDPLGDFPKDVKS